MIAFPDIPKPARCVTEVSTFGHLPTPDGRLAIGIRHAVKHIPDAPVEVLIGYTPTGGSTESLVVVLPPAFVYGLAGLLADVMEQAMADGALLPREAAAFAAAQAAAARRLAEAADATGGAPADGSDTAAGG